MSLRKIRITQIPIHRLTSLTQAVLVAIATTCGIGVKATLADPPPAPPPHTKLPPVFS
ncbi:hypothetical protein [Okeania sp. KiyG1]|uniref:hypothetical protein n=1 Tax=Okeania sp. KiyG1 TaxID=2720165 RepID=UPI001921EA1C|nr:hypothetical protein [Okeania sp. KiyG1]GGA15888.1 hypothetical protein CYANOKiyG1_29930 [Okeania sp. KiyG1]